jgi:hypothetical protein
MKLPQATLTTARQLQEFDIWITPSLGEIKDTPQFVAALEAAVRTFDLLAAATNDFASEADIDQNRIADSIVAEISGKETEAGAILKDLAQVLFLVTGKSCIGSA